MSAAPIFVRDAFRAALLAVPALAGGNVLVGRKRRLPEGMAQALVVRFGGAQPDERAILAAPIDWASTVIVEAVARDADDAEALCYALHEQAYARLQVDPTLAGALDYIGPPSFAEVELEDNDDEQLAAVAAIYPVQHRTQAGSLAA